MSKINVEGVTVIGKAKTEDGNEYRIKHDATGKEATLSKGWLRLGGNQWIISSDGMPPFGESTLQDAARLFRRRCNA